jgi:hypothetical protein
MPFFRIATLALFLVLAFLGCKQSTSSTHGNVTYEGTPVHRGQITFTPADGHGQARSGKVESGNYTVEDVPPGKKIVQIIGVKETHVPKTHAEMAEAAKRGPPKTVESADEVPANAVGNGQTIETKQGSQEFNFELKRPKGG